MIGEGGGESCRRREGCALCYLRGVTWLGERRAVRSSRIFLQLLYVGPGYNGTGSVSI